MATVSVASWAEFVEAIAVSGDTVVCPENAVWDANDFAPNWLDDEIQWNCAEVRGNGTIIRNLHMRGIFYTSVNTTQYIRDLHFLDFIADGVREQSGIFYGKFAFVGCKLTGILATNYRFLVRCTGFDSNTFSFDKCSLNVEFATNMGIWPHEGLGAGFRYSRIQIKAANTIAIIILHYCQYCEVVLYIPNASDTFSSKMFLGCTVRGNFHSIPADSASWGWSGANSVYCNEDFPAGWTPSYPQNFIGVTDAQLRNPQYLRSIGFPISAESGGD